METDDKLRLIRNWSTAFKTMETNKGKWYGVVTHCVASHTSPKMYYDHESADYIKRDNAINAAYDYVKQLVWGLTG